MELYFTPFACSLATRIALYEAEQPAVFHSVDLLTKRLEDGTDYLAINPKGQVPTLRTAGGELLTEGAAVLQYVADQAPAHSLAPPAGTMERAFLHQWLNYISTEIHKAVFNPIFNPRAPHEVKAFARAALASKFDYLQSHLRHRAYLQSNYSVADAYLFVALGWAKVAGIDLEPWPALVAYRQRIAERPAVARALADEQGLRGAA